MEYSNKKLYIFDLDDTLAVSKSIMDSDMKGLLLKLLKDKKVAIISGGKFEQFINQALKEFVEEEKVFFTNLYLLPTCGTRMYIFDKDLKDWKLIYSDDFTEEEKQEIISAMNKMVSDLNYIPEKVWGEFIDDRQSQISFSALGQEAPSEIKKMWDINHEKKREMTECLRKILGDKYSINFNGSTTIDVTKLNIDKAYGAKKILEYLNFEMGDAVFVGDRLEEGGNDYPVKKIGIDCVSTTGPVETKEIIRNKFLNNA